MAFKIERQPYAEMFGPTVGDQVRLADTELFIEAERDLIAEGGGYGNEIKFGGGKVIRDGMGQSARATGDAEVHQLAVSFGGGGHAKAAGAQIDARLDKARRLVIERRGNVLVRRGLRNLVD